MKALVVGPSGVGAGAAKPSRNYCCGANATLTIERRRSGGRFGGDDDDSSICYWKSMSQTRTRTSGGSGGKSFPPILLLLHENKKMKKKKKKKEPQQPLPPPEVEVEVVVAPSPPLSPKPHTNAFSFLIDLLEKLYIWAFFPHLSKPLRFLRGNFAPVPEHPPTPHLPVVGHLPSCLNGEFVRIGPNPCLPPAADYHWFDGDGMIHGLRIKDGNASYACRYVQTSRFKQEEYFGASKFLKVGDLKGIFGFLMGQIFSLRARFKVIDVSHGSGPGNTAMTYHDGRLLALSEADKPYAIRVLEDGDLLTLGLVDYEKRLNHAFTAHPKIDPVTGELFTFCYQFEAPYCIYRVVSKDGMMQDAVPITVSGPIIMHDFAITEKYAIFMDMPLYFQPKAMVRGDLIVNFDCSKPARIGILPRYAKNESAIKWFELPTCYALHNVNAWEEGEDVVLYTCRIPTVELEMFSGPDNGKKLRESENQLYEWRFNLQTGKASQKQLSLSSVDFPRVNEKYIGRKQQFAYCALLKESTQIIGVVKFDLWAEPEFEGKQYIETGGNVKGVILFGSGRYGSEAIFVPRSSGEDDSEDDGYLICFVHDEHKGTSEAHIYDAKTMAADPVGMVKLPSRVPYGFHALFVSEEQLSSQK